MTHRYWVQLRGRLRADPVIPFSRDGVLVEQRAEEEEQARALAVSRVRACFRNVLLTSITVTPVPSGVRP